jgi:surface antigen
MSVADLNQQFLTNVSNKKQQRFQENNDLISSGTKKLNELALRNTTKQETPVIQEEIKEPQVDMEKQRLAAVDRAIGTMEKEDYSQINPVEVTPVEIERMSPISETKPLERTPEETQQVEQATLQTPNSVVESQNGQSVFTNSKENGYKFNAPKNSLVGECAWYAEQITRMPDGSSWTIGSTIDDKKNQFANHVKNGNAFYAGQGTAQAGNSIVFNGGQYGHVAVIEEIKDGKARLNESNYGNDKTVKTTRWVSLSDPSIIGFLKTIPA